jgi:hypothetical protein
MRPNGSGKDTAILRRETVARLRLRGLSIREIAASLGEKLPNPRTGKPWGLATIHSDLEAMKTTWQESANVATAEHRAREFAELQEIKREAAKQIDLSAWIRALKEEIALLGTSAPQKLDIGLNLAQELESAADEFERLVNRQVAANAAGYGTGAHDNRTESGAALDLEPDRPT